MNRLLLTKLALISAAVFLPNPSEAQTPIHKCTNADGGIEYSQLPCVSENSVEPAETVSGEELEEEDIEIEQPVIADSSAPEDVPERDPDTSACKKRYRDAIDAIDVEIGREYSTDKADQYKQRLLALTRKLRQC